MSNILDPDQVQPNCPNCLERLRHQQTPPADTTTSQRVNINRPMQILYLFLSSKRVTINMETRFRQIILIRPSFPFMKPVWHLQNQYFKTILWVSPPADATSSQRVNINRLIRRMPTTYWSGAKLRYMGYFSSLLQPPGRKSWLLFSIWDMSWGLINPSFT